MRRDIFQATADPTRRDNELVVYPPMTPNSLAAHFRCSRQAVSRHLRILNECALLKQGQNGREIFYQLNVKKMKPVDKWLKSFRQIWENRFSQLDDVLTHLK